MQYIANFLWQNAIPQKYIPWTRFLAEVEWRSNYEGFAVKTFISCQIWLLRGKGAFGALHHHDIYQGNRKLS